MLGMFPVSRRHSRLICSFQICDVARTPELGRGGQGVLSWVSADRIYLEAYVLTLLQGYANPLRSFVCIITPIT